MQRLRACFLDDVGFYTLAGHVVELDAFVKIAGQDIQYFREQQ
jgi:hypothetical protein